MLVLRPGDAELGADQRPQPDLARGAVEARQTRDAVAVGERERRVAPLDGGIHEIFGVAAGLQEGEGAPSAQLDVVMGGRHLGLSLYFRCHRTLSMLHSVLKGHPS